MAYPTNNGIEDVEYGTASALTAGGSGTSISDIIADGFDDGTTVLTPLDEEGNPVDSDGNEYAGVRYWEWTVVARDLTAYTTLSAGRSAGTKYYFAADFAGGGRVNTTAKYRISKIRRAKIAAKTGGVSDAFIMTFRVKDSDMNFA